MVELLVLVRDVVLAVLLSWAGVEYDSQSEETDAPREERAAVFQLTTELPIQPASFTAEPDCVEKAAHKPT